MQRIGTYHRHIRTPLADFEVPEEVESAAETPVDLSTLKHAQLRSLAKQKGVSASGKSADIIARLEQVV